MGSLLKKVLTRKMVPNELDHLKRLMAYMRQLNRIKFGESTPQQYLDAVTSVEILIPREMREGCAQYELHPTPSCDYLRHTVQSTLSFAVSKTLSSVVKNELSRIIESNLYEPHDLSDVDSSDSSYSPPQQVPDQDEPHAKKSKN